MRSHYVATSFLIYVQYLLFLLQAHAFPFPCQVKARVLRLCSITSQDSAETHSKNNILILDHLNINHERGRHDWVKGFYVDFLKCTLDPRKIENVRLGKKTIWTNIGAHQFHLPEGKPDAQVLNGIVTLVYPDLKQIKTRYNLIQKEGTLGGSLFELKDCVAATNELPADDSDNSYLVTDPWGSMFRLVQGTKDKDGDIRGSQPNGNEAEGFAMRDITLQVPLDSNVVGIGRFYEQVLGSRVVRSSTQNGHDKDSPSYIQIAVGPQQTLTFVTNPDASVDSHVDLRDEGGNSLSNYGPHISMYVADFPATYKRAESLGVAYVNTRFKRRAYNLEEAIDDCMFRCLDIIDPNNVEQGPILKLEHEVRSVVKRDGSLYKSCPFYQIPDGCGVQ